MKCVVSTLIDRQPRTEIRNFKRCYTKIAEQLLSMEYIRWICCNLHFNASARDQSVRPSATSRANLLPQLKFSWISDSEVRKPFALQSIIFRFSHSRHAHYLPN